MANQDRVGRLFQQIAGNQKAYKVLDDRLVFVDPADETKRVRLDAGSVATATTRVLTAPDYDVALGTGLGGRRPVVSADAIDATAVVTLTAAMSGTVLDLDMATVTVNLPALAAGVVGADGIFFTFVTTATATAQIIAAASGDILHGGCTIMSTAVGAENDAFSSNGSSNLVITMNGTTKGGIIGSRWDVWAMSATKWIVTGNLIGSGTIVTPFSDT